MNSRIFHLGELLGQGGFGEVRIGKLSNGGPVARKFFKNRDEFLFERHIHSHLSHRNIIQFLGSDDRFPDITTELGSWSFRDIIKKKFPITDFQILCWAAHVCSGLSYLNAQMGMTHNDIKPENLVVVGDSVQGWVAKIIDFGLCRKWGVEDFTGTLEYSSKELLETIFKINPRSQSPVGYQSDIWSVGVTFLELATGVYPLHVRPIGDDFPTPQQFLEAVDDFDFNLLFAQHRRAVGADVLTILMARCLVKNAALRPIPCEMALELFVGIAKLHAQPNTGTAPASLPTPDPAPQEIISIRSSRSDLIVIDSA